MRQTLRWRSGTQPRHPLEGTYGWRKTPRGKPVANHLIQAGHAIHNIRVKGLWLLFTDNTSDGKDMECHLIDKLGSRRPGGMKEKLFFLHYCAPLILFSPSDRVAFHLGDASYKVTWSGLTDAICFFTSGPLTGLLNLLGGWVVVFSRRGRLTERCNFMCLRALVCLIQGPCYRQGSPCQDPAGNRATHRHPDHCKEIQTAVVWSCLPFIRSGQNHLARHSERGKKTRQTDEEVGRQHQGVDRPEVRQVPDGRGEQG